MHTLATRVLPACSSVVAFIPHRSDPTRLAGAVDDGRVAAVVLGPTRTCVAPLGASQIDTMALDLRASLEALIRVSTTESVRCSSGRGCPPSSLRPWRLWRTPGKAAVTDKLLGTGVSGLARGCVRPSPDSAHPFAKVFFQQRAAHDGAGAHACFMLFTPPPRA